ncbi:MAG: hypothetical protein V4548_10745 [Bacteroidota bacterium]
MKNLDKLSDEQLINLFKNNNIDKELKITIISEMDRRDLKKLEETHLGFDFYTKIEIILTNYFCYKKHLKKSSEMLISGNRIGYKQYWRFFIYGVIFYTIIGLLIAKYFIKPLSQK